MDQIEFNNLFRNRTKAFVIRILKFYQGLRKLDETRIIGKQLIRCCSSVGANFRASCLARSVAERYAKMCIVVEEADEVIFWLELLEAGGYADNKTIAPLHKEALEILKVMSSSRKKLRQLKG